MKFLVDAQLPIEISKLFNSRGYNDQIISALEKGGMIELTTTGVKILY